MDASEPRDRDPSGPGDRLDSWKEIAAYLRRSPRTVQRWERLEGLPVHRLVHDKLGSVYAYRAELDAWWAERRTRLEAEADEGQTDAAAAVTAVATPPDPGEPTTTVAEVAALEAMAPAATRTRRWFGLAIGLGVVAAIVVLVVVWTRSGPQPIASAERVRIAVLPFTNLTGDPSREYLGDGLTEELIASLGRVRDLGVIARTSVMRYKATDRTARQIGQELSVDYVLEGSIRGDAARVRVTAQLIRASDEIHLWADSYDREVKDLLRIETDVATRVAEQIRLRLPVVTARGVNPDAHLAYLQGRYSWNKRTEPDFRRAIGFFEQAIAIDPSYAPAYSGLADAYLLLSNYGHMAVEEALPKAKQAANRALVLDDSLAEGHASLGFAIEVYDRDLRVAAQQFERALALNPNYATGRMWYGLLLINLGRFEEARAQLMTGLQADPFSSSIRSNIAGCDFFSGRYDVAIEQLREDLAREPDRAFTELELGRIYIQKGDYENGLVNLRHARSHAGGDLMFDAVLGYGLARAGQRAEAEEIFDRLVRESGARRVPPYYMAIVSAGLDRRDEAFRWLEQTLSERHISALSVNVEPELSSLRSDPRFPDLRRRAGLE